MKNISESVVFDDADGDTITKFRIQKAEEEIIDMFIDIGGAYLSPGGTNV